MHRVVVAQLGARRHYAVPRTLYRAGLLEKVVTDVCAEVPPWRWLALAVPERYRLGTLRRVIGRSMDGVPRELIVGTPFLQLLLDRCRRPWESNTDRWARLNAAFCRGVVRRGLGEADTVYAFNGAALEIFRAARERGLRTVLDQTAAPWRWNGRLLREEMERWPGWEHQPAELDVSGVLSAREEAEWDLSDAIVCGSSFCCSTLTDSGVPVSKCHVMTYHAEDSLNETSRSRSDSQRRPMRVLYAGTLQLRKGVQYLYEAAKTLSGEAVEFRLVGPSLLSEESNRRLGEYCDVVGAVPRARMADQYRWADVLVLPTLSEGSANVCQEAMAAGIPVITTPAAGSAVQDGIHGLIVRERDTSALAKALIQMANDPEARCRFGEAARTSVSRQHEADLYADELRSVLEYVGLDSNRSKV